MIPKEIASLQHPIIKYAYKLRTDRAFREQEQRVVIAGSKLTTEQSPLTHLFVLKSHSFRADAGQVFHVTEGMLKKITGLAQPEPVAAILRLPTEGDLSGKRYLLALDAVADPGNVGALLRSALALGFEGAFLTEGACDPFNDKALRAARGATFLLPLRCGRWEELQALIDRQGLHVYIADAKGKPLPTSEILTPLVLVLGNESRGVSSVAKKNHRSVSIPMHEKSESLNVASAGAILMYALRGPL